MAAVQTPWRFGGSIAGRQGHHVRRWSAGAVFDAYDLEAIAGTDQKDAVGTFFNEGVSGITALLDEAYGNPEAKDVMQPALDRFLTRFEVFGG